MDSHVLPDARKCLTLSSLIGGPVSFVIDAPFGRFAPKGDSIFVFDGMRSDLVSLGRADTSPRTQSMDCHGDNIPDHVSLRTLHCPLGAIRLWPAEPQFPAKVAGSPLPRALRQSCYHLPIANAFSFETSSYCYPLRDFLQYSEWFHDGVVPFEPVCFSVVPGPPINWITVQAGLDPLDFRVHWKYYPR